MTATTAHSGGRHCQGVTILGSTGSIGINTLNVISQHPDKYRVIALTANRQVDVMFEQCARFAPEVVVMADEASGLALEHKVRDAGLKTKVHAGVEALKSTATLPEVDIVMAAIVGAAGLLPTLEAVRSGKRILLANKEPLVMCGDVFIQEANRSGAELLPIDSEHNAIFQCMPAGYRPGSLHEGIRRILLTCSGGPFRGSSMDDLAGVTPEQACAHPNWSMGKKISVDSATLMNKGLELIEACWLFNISPENVQVVIHPQSVIHSMVEYLDGSVLAQMGNPDMRTPIAHALAWPARIESGVASLDLFDIRRLEFEQPDFDRFPCLKLAYRAAKIKGTAPAIMNAANEVAVQAFLDGIITFPDIPRVIEKVMEQVTVHHGPTVEVVLKDDTKARRYANTYITSLDDGRKGTAQC